MNPARAVSKCIVNRYAARITAAGALLQALALSGCGGDGAATGQPLPREASVATTRIEDAAARALLTNALSDDEPPRWNALEHPLLCTAGSTVTVDGTPLQPGAAVPLGSFRLDWQLNGACPLGPDGPHLYGALSMIVMRDDEFGLIPLISWTR
jgi:hypothetical protein